MTAAIVLGLFATYGAPWIGLPRPLAFAVLATIAVQLVATLITRHPLGAALVAALVMGALLLPKEATVAAMFCMSLATLLYRARTHHLPSTSRIAGLVTPIALAGIVVGLAMTANSNPYLRWNGPASAVVARNAGDIYVILLDGHPRLDTLAAELGGDPTWFRAAMQDQGFVEATKATSNYNLTFLTLASMFDGTHIADSIPDPPSTGGLRVVNQLLNNGRQIDRIRMAGYEIISIPSPFTQAALVNADRYLDDGRITDFELSVALNGILPQLVPDQLRTLLMNDHRARVHDTFDRLRSLASERHDRARLVFAHVLAPHRPTAFTKDGAPVSGLPCFPVECSLWNNGEKYPAGRIAALRDQVEYIDREVVDVVRSIRAASTRPPTIIVFSDHGLRHDLDDQIEAFRSLLMVSSPDHRLAFPADVSLVNVVRILANAVTGEDEPMADRRFEFLELGHIDTTGPFAWQPVPPPN